MSDSSERRSRRCPYAVSMYLDDGTRRVLVRCSRRRTWWPHYHRADLLGTTLSAVPHLSLRWSSMAGPDFHVRYEQSSEIIEGYSKHDAL